MKINKTKIYIMLLFMVFVTSMLYIHKISNNRSDALQHTELVNEDHELSKQKEVLLDYYQAIAHVSYEVSDAASALIVLTDKTMNNIITNHSSNIKKYQSLVDTLRVNSKNYPLITLTILDDIESVNDAHLVIMNGVVYFDVSNINF
ncbi:hypothetical protein [Mycoplasma sp. P36-A1]|uniref:hypothetical protein n=1 Tax=Mycoplasma sp. P36-A1 TaxID=3252900 RepID=UPI003C2F9331